MPKFIRDELHIPNPLTEAHRYYNKLLIQLYKTSYNSSLSPVQISQRLLRWKLIQDFEKVEKSFDDLIGNGKSGNAFNVKKYSSESTGGLSAKDLRRAENSFDMLSSLLKKIGNLKSSLNDYRANLFSINHKIKDWKVDELQFYDKLIAKCSTMEIEVNVTSSKVNATVRNLKRNFSTSAADTAEQKRQKKRKIESEWKTKDGKKKRLLATTLNLFRQICSDKWTDEAQEESEKSANLSSSNIRISKTDLENFVKKNTLKPRFNLSALINIIEQDIFEKDEAKNYATEQKINLEQKAAKVSADNKESKKKKGKKVQDAKSQTTIVNLLKKSKS